MRVRMMVAVGVALVALVLGLAGARAQDVAASSALSGLAPFNALPNTEPGKAALAANLARTSAIQLGTAHQPVLLRPFARQEEQALKDAFITSENAAQLSDGLGSTLAKAYQSLASYSSSDDGKTIAIVYPSVALSKLIADAYTKPPKDSNAAKYYFATSDVYGQAYHLPAASPGADSKGNSRPFQTEPRLRRFKAPDYFGVTVESSFYLSGQASYPPQQDLRQSPAFPSGHTTYGFTQGLLLALLVPERFPQMVARAAEYGNDRIVLGAHYTMDVIGGRTLASHDLAHLLAADSGAFAERVKERRDELEALLAKACGHDVAICAKRDHGRFADKARLRKFYESTQTYRLPPVYPDRVKTKESVADVAPEAGYLLVAAFPYLKLDEADAILTATEGPGGGFLDDGSAFGVYSRLDLFKAGERALARAPRAKKGG